MAATTLVGIEGVRQRAGGPLGVSRWHEVRQDEVDLFAEVTGDDQWIHVDPERARRSPFGGTIAHGYFTLALAPRFTYELYEITDVAYGVNYGLNRVRFPAPLRVGARVRMRADLERVDDVPGGIQLITLLTFESDSVDKPVCVAETLTRIYA